jgi:predicted alpha/beta-fold hydrolase
MKDMSYLPTLYLYHPFLQSVYNVLTPEKYNIDYRREILSLPDQGQISLDWAYSAKEMPEKKILFILHGLTGGSEMPYVQSLVTEAMKEGFRTVVCHNRGIDISYFFLKN